MHGPPDLLNFAFNIPHHLNMTLTRPEHCTDWRPGGPPVDRWRQRTMQYKNLPDQFSRVATGKMAPYGREFLPNKVKKGLSR